MKIRQINYWFALFDFAEGRIAGQVPLKFPELDILYEPNVSISASGKLSREELRSPQG